MDALGVGLAILVCALLGRHLVKERRYKERHRIAAYQIFRNQVVSSVDPRFQFNGSSACIVEEKETIEKVNGTFLAYTLTRISQNPSGEYFWFHFRSDSSPMIKYLDHGRAKLLLKSKYIAPNPEK